ncbi:hypothetical protein HMPREF1318_1593 [Actinomyces massiliensis F0489]|uniref:Uncharacterized protein n=1 Tax=Actinomyces massiliensis F0489 TaxID=1125718 RepID=J0WNG1_9ACTO|nr:hypothetical protein HMPREF1318_1593 [Actinomyces massiliensis F0489]
MRLITRALGEAGFVSLDRSRCGLRPISVRSTTDLDAELDRSRCGTRPISAMDGRPAPHAPAPHDERAIAPAPPRTLVLTIQI